MGEIINVSIYALLFASLYFEVFLLITFLELFFQKERKDIRSGNVPHTSGGLPSVTVLVPCYNEEKAVSKTISSLLNLDYPKDKLRIFAIDDGSTDNTWGTLQCFEKYNQVQLFQKENGGKHTALNLGLLHATTDLVGCLDADSYVKEDALKEIVKHFTEKEIMCVTPAIKLHEPKTIFEHIQKAEYALSIFIRRVFSHVDSLFITPGPFTIFRKSVFNSLGNYREAHNTEDMEIALRMQKNHYKIANAPTAHVYTNAPKTWMTLFKQRRRWTYGFLQNSRDYKSIFFKKGYGHLGIFILPMALFSILPAIFFSIFLLNSAFNFLLNQIERIQAVGFSLPSASAFSIFFNSTSFIIIIYIIALFSFLFIIIGKYLSSDKYFGIDIPLYLFLYGFLAPWWLLRGVFDVVQTNKQSWTDEIEIRTRI